MKIFVYSIVVIFFINNSCTAGSLYEAEDTTSKVIDINVANNIFTKGMNEISSSDLYKDTLYLINKDKLVIIDLKTRNISTNIKVNLFLSKQLKLNKYANKIVARDKNYYINFLNDLYSISKDGDVIKIYTDYYFIKDFEVLDNSILIASRDTLKNVTKKGNVLSSIQFRFTDAGYIQSSGVISYSEVEDSVYEFSLNKDFTLKINTFAPIYLNKVMDEPYISYSTDNYFLAFDYWKRNTVYVLKKDTKQNKVIRTINLKGINYTPTQAEIQKEEGIPNFKIEYSNNIFYIIALLRNQLRVSSFSL